MNTENWRNSYGKQSNHIIKNIKIFGIIRESKRTTTINNFEWAIAKEMYIDFNRLFAQLGATYMTINTLKKILEYINGVNIRYSDDKLIDIEYSMDRHKYGTKHYCNKR